MAKLFLSYAREDSAEAERLARSLERAGHSVWWDRDLTGGASFGPEIEQRLKSSDVVIVLWSGTSVQSPWVRDEAAIGRDAGRLLPVSIDGIEPPIGFRQYHVIDLPSRRGRARETAIRKVEQAVKAVANLSPSGQGPSLPPSKSAIRLPLAPRAFGLVIVLLIAAFAAFWWFGQRAQSGSSIAVVAAASGADGSMAREYATTIATDMAPIVSLHSDNASVIDPASAPTDADYRVSVVVSKSGEGAQASLALSSRHNMGIIWSKSWNVPDLRTVDLKQQMSLAASQAVLCALEGRRAGPTLKLTSLSLYVNGCVALANREVTDRELASLFAKLVKLEPNFAPAWADYAYVQAMVAAETVRGTGPIAASAKKDALAAIARARVLNPRSAMIYAAQAWLDAQDSVRALALIDKAVAVEPDSALLHTLRAELLRSVGRMRESVNAAQRAVELDPLSPGTRSVYINALTYNGNFSQARDEITNAQRTWPNSYAIQTAAFGFNLRYGDPAKAEQLLPKVLEYSDTGLEPFRTILVARARPSAAATENAVAILRGNPHELSRHPNQYLLALGLFGKVEEAYALMADSRFKRRVDTDILFRPEFTKIRADPRFIKVAAEQGLLSYWLASGEWPDFCSNEPLPYDCKAEAAKYR